MEFEGKGINIFRKLHYVIHVMGDRRKNGLIKGKDLISAGKESKLKINYL